MNSALCPSHQQPSTGACLRCGTFLCAQCGPLSTCPSCMKFVQVPAEQLAARGQRARRWAVFSWLGLVAVILLGGLAAALFPPIALLFVLFPPVGLGTGIFALVLHRGTGAPNVLLHALGGIAMNAIVLGALALIFLG